jgi:hypothetical protein
LAGFVLELHRNGAQRGRVFAGVVRTEEQSASGRQYRAQVCTGTAPVASISGRQGRRSQHRSHVHVLLIGE